MKCALDNIDLFSRAFFWTYGNGAPLTPDANPATKDRQTNWSVPDTGRQGGQVVRLRRRAMVPRIGSVYTPANARRPSVADRFALPPVRCCYRSRVGPSPCSGCCGKCRRSDDGIIRPWAKAIICRYVRVCGSVYGIEWCVLTCTSGTCWSLLGIYAVSCVIRGSPWYSLLLHGRGRSGYYYCFRACCFNGTIYVVIACQVCHCSSSSSWCYCGAAVAVVLWCIVIRHVSHSFTSQRTWLAVKDY